MSYASNGAENIDVKSLLPAYGIRVCNFADFSQSAMVDYETVESTKRRFSDFDSLFRYGKICEVSSYDFDMAWKFGFDFSKSGLVPANNDQVMFLRLRKDVLCNGQTQSCAEFQQLVSQIEEQIYPLMLRLKGLSWMPYCPRPIYL